MHRFLPTIVILNWLAVLAVLAFAGFGFSGPDGGFVAVMNGLAVSGELAFLPEFLVNSIPQVTLLIVLVAAVWALLAIAFANPETDEAGDIEVVVTAAFGACLILFTALLLLALMAGQAELGALLSVASFATVLAGIANRIFAVVTIADTVAEGFTNKQMVKGRIGSKARQSARLATFGIKNNRLVAKRNNNHTDRYAS